MSIYTKVVNSNVKTESIHTSIEGVIHPIGVVYTFINGERKKVYPDEDPTSDPIIEFTTPGTHKVTLPAGLYKFTMRGAGGGAAAGVHGKSFGCAAGGGGAATAVFELLLSTQETFTFVAGTGGVGHFGSNYQTGGAGTVTSISSNIRTTMLTFNGGGGGSTYCNSGQDPRNNYAYAGDAGIYTDNLTSTVSKSITPGAKGNATHNTSSMSTIYYGNGGDYGGGNAVADAVNGSQSRADSGSNGYLKIEPATQYTYISPITTSITLDPGTYYFEIVGAGGGGLGVYGASAYAYANGASAASGFGYFKVDTQGVYNIQVGTGGSGQSGSASVTSVGDWTSGNGTASYIIRAADNFNIVTCGGGTGASWHYDGSQSGGEYFNYLSSGGTYSTSLTENYTLANGTSGSGSWSKADDPINYPSIPPKYFSVYGIGGYGRRLYGTSTSPSEEHNGHAGTSGMLKIYKYN